MESGTDFTSQPPKSLALGKRILLRAIGYGAGAAIVLVVAALSAYYFTRTPSGWNSRALKVKAVYFEVAPPQKS